MLKKSLYLEKSSMAGKKLAKILFYLYIKMRIHAATLKMIELRSHQIWCVIQVNMLSCQAQHTERKRKKDRNQSSKQPICRNCIFGSD